MSQFRCHQCNQLQFKYRIRGNKLEIEVKCYSCNQFSYFEIWLNRLNSDIQEKEEETSEKEFQKDGKRTDISEELSKNIGFRQKNRNEN